MRPNSFVALPVDPGTWFETRVDRCPPRVRRFPPADLHLTVAFFGALPLDRAVAAWQAQVARAELGGPVQASLGPVVPMGNRRRPSALSALLDQGQDRVCALIEALRGPLLDHAGARPDTRPPRPHLTLARPQRRASDAQRRTAVAWAQSLDVQGVPVLLDRIALYTWAEDRPQRLFRIVAQRPL